DMLGHAKRVLIDKETTTIIDVSGEKAAIQARIQQLKAQIEELVPVLEREGVTLNMEPHPEDWCETLNPAIDMLKTIGSK
ncbi:hypothetical protein ACC738_38705, partial [Rhizobium ruizarguesonis]